MFIRRNAHEAYWKSYRLLESELLKLSHSVCFDDNQINVYSTELADIINSACVKIESLAKDIYENHILPFQLDAGCVPPSFEKPAKKFKPEEWTRNKWKFDYNCLVEIDNKFSLSKKQIELKAERFHFVKYGSTILPFGNISSNNCNGGFWQYLDEDRSKLQTVDWCKSYQDIKHNYIESIPLHGTVKNAIMVLAAFYLLSVYYSCLPFRQFELDDMNGRLKLDFGSDLFSCRACNYTFPPCIIDSEYVKKRNSPPKTVNEYKNGDVFEGRYLLDDIEGLPFLITLNKDACSEVNKLVSQYCDSKGLDKFDIALYKNNCGVASDDDGAVLYHNIKNFVIAPYRRNNICVTFNTGTESVYQTLFTNLLEYEKSKYEKQTAVVLSSLKVGDIVDAKFVFVEHITEAKVVKITEHCIDLSISKNGRETIISNPKSNIIYIRKAT